MTLRETKASLWEGGGPQGRRERALPRPETSEFSNDLSPTRFAGAPSQRGPKTYSVVVSTTSPIPAVRVTRRVVVGVWV